jgi:hypothetical protein
MQEVSLHKAVELSAVKPNPFRDLTVFPLDEGKVESLVGSINTNGFWENVVGRQVGESIELAYGHHRIEAFRRVHGNGATVNIIVKPLDDEAMILAMAHENMTDWAASAAVEMETVRAVVLAAAAGKITLPAVGRDGVRSVRIAPGFVPVSPKEVRGSSRAAYTEATLAEFIGKPWTANKSENALSMLAATEQAHVPASALTGVGPRMGREIVTAAGVARQRARSAGRSEAEAVKAGAEVAEKLSEAVRKGEATLHGSQTGASEQITVVRDRIIQQVVPPTAAAPAPVIPNEVVRGVANQFFTLLKSIEQLNALLVAHPEAARFVREAKGGAGQVNYLPTALSMFDPEYQRLVEVIVNGKAPVAKPTPITSGAAPATAKVVSK